MQSSEMTDLIDELELPPLTVKVPRNTTFRQMGYGWHPLDDFDSIMPDLDRLIKSIIANSTDRRNINLHFDELYGSMQEKLAAILRRRDTVFPTRANFFGLVKVSLVRHTNSLIQKFNFTYKRTGVKPPKRHEWPDDLDRQPHTEDDLVPEPEHEEPQVTCRGEVSLNNADCGAQNFVGQVAPEFGTMEVQEELNFFIRRYLTPLEARVIRQEVQPNDAAMQLAYDAGASNTLTRKFKILDKHKAEGLGMPVYAYKRTMLKIKSKLQKHWNY